jgi:hypothetical protein
MFIGDPNFSIPDPESRVKKIPDPASGSTSKNLSIFNPKIVSNSRNVPEYSSQIRIPDLDFLPSPDPKVKKVPDTGSRLSNTAGKESELD